ncbi:MAG: hypothetical protein ACE5JN_05200 [Candidatus Methylomirabilia bacterium]
MNRGPMKTLAGAVTVVLLAAGCGRSLTELAGFPAAGKPSVSIQSLEPRWVLIKNPRFGDVPSEPEYIWVEEDKIPRTFGRILFGKRSLIAPPEIAARYGSPPGGGKISPVQGGADGRRQPAPGSEGAAAPVARSRGYVVYVDTTRIVIDLTAKDGLRLGGLVSLHGEKLPIVHPVTGELLGELDEEVGRAKVVEIRDRFSVAEIQFVAPGETIKVKDRVVPR